MTADGSGGEAREELPVDGVSLGGGAVGYQSLAQNQGLYGQIASGPGSHRLPTGGSGAGTGNGASGGGGGGGSGGAGVGTGAGTGGSVSTGEMAQGGGQAVGHAGGQPSQAPTGNSHW